ncbi:MAG: hypothetical protein WC412_08030 [Candidatus Omnitrophota bacterium]
MTNTLGIGDNDGSGGITGADAPDPTNVSQQGDLWVSGSVGIKTGVTGPQRALHVVGTDGMRLAPSARPSSPAAGDIVVDSSDSNTLKWWNGTKWAAAGGGGACYIAYFPYTHSQKTANSGTIVPGSSCHAGFTDEGSIGEYGACWCNDPYETEYGIFLPPGGKCDDGTAYGWRDSPIYLGQGHLCCKQ